MSDESLTQFRTEGAPAFPENPETANSPASSAETTTTAQTPSPEGEHTPAPKKDDGDAGFADHPRWKERETNWNQRFNDQEQRHVQELDKIRAEIEARVPKDNKTPIPAWFGGDDDQYQAYLKDEEARISQAEERVLKRLTTAQQEEQQRIEKATTYFNEQVTTLEADKTLNPTGDKIDRNRLLKTAQDFDLTDSKGNWNYKAAFMFMKNQSKPNLGVSPDRKDLASATTSENRAEPTRPSYKTSADFTKPGERPW